MSRIGEGAISDRNLITTLVMKNRTYGPEWDIYMRVLTNLDGIIRPQEAARRDHAESGSAVRIINSMVRCIEYAERCNVCYIMEKNVIFI